VKKPTVKMRKPPSADLEAFVAAGDQPASKGKRATKPTRSTEVWRPTRGTVMRRLTLYLPPDVARAFHARCVAEGTSMSAMLERWVADYIAKR
jgi:hypothetical protein